MKRVHYEEADNTTSQQEEKHRHLRPPSSNLTLPPELLANICRFANKPSTSLELTLPSLALVSKEWNAAATKEMYSQIEVDWRAGKCQKLIKAFELNPALCGIVRKVAARFSTESEWRDDWLFETGPGTRALMLSQTHFVTNDPVRGPQMNDEANYEGFLRHSVAAAWHLKGDATWLKDRVAGFEAFFTWISTLNNLRHLAADNFDNLIRDPLRFDSPALSLAIPILASLDHLALTSNEDLMSQVTKVNLKILPHLTSIRHLDLSLSDFDDLSSLTVGPAFIHLEYLRLKLSRPRAGSALAPEIDYFHRVTNLKELHLFIFHGIADPEKSRVLHSLVNKLPHLPDLHSFTILFETRQAEDWTIFTPELSSALAKTEIETLRLRTWPPEAFLSLLPNSITTLAIEDLSPLAAESKQEVLEACLGWKEKYLPNLKKLFVAERSDPRMRVEVKWTATTERAKDFVFTFKDSCWKNHTARSHW
ncbi:hypothetical protein P7C70_g5645, partial [Phenoliferia sp. Uapishka_3]